MQLKKRKPLRDNRLFLKNLRAFYRRSGRSLPWRETHDPYRILVSEFMLQQTQVKRVISFYENFVKRFPTVQRLAAASLANVLREWNGLGYNRRAKYLWLAAKRITEDFAGVVPKDVEALQTLPGVGRYTAGAIRAFAFDLPAICVETNIRTVIIKEFFPKRRRVSDSEIVSVLSILCPRRGVRSFYHALMDYGASIKKETSRFNHRSTAYSRQSAFKGSTREIRGAVLQALRNNERTTELKLKRRFPGKASVVPRVLAELQREGLIQQRGGVITYP